MVVASPITPSVVDAVAAAVFAKPGPVVVEAYSAPDQEPLRFEAERELADYIKAEVSQPRGLAHVLVGYPDMGGTPVRRTIHLDPRHCPGHTLRYAWNGWGMISVQLYGEAQYRRSRVAALSRARASATAPAHPEWGSPDAWNWKAVASHTRRLQRVLAKVTQGPERTGDG